jgi:methylase of polypeptide subunit release factors
MPRKKGKSEEALGYIAELNKKTMPYDGEICEVKLHIERGVYYPDELGWLWHRALTNPNYGIQPGNKVLDYGTGSGFLAIVAAKQGAQSVVAVDINQGAIDCASQNATTNGVANKIEFRQGDAFSTVKDGEKFDVIIASCPWEDAEPDPNVPLEDAFFDDDYKMRAALFREGKKHLTANGFMFFSYAKRMEEKAPINEFTDEYGYDYRIVEEAVIDNEPHYIYKIMPRR